jgi:hypothetical protein
VHLEAMIREIVSLLASYREEDLPLFPQVFVFSSPEGLKALAPSSTQVTIGTIPLAAESAAGIIKSCAPLAKGGWSIFVVKETDGQRLRYGLFRSLRHSLSTASEESMGGLGREMPVIMIRNRGHLIVDLTSTAGTRFTVALTTTPAKPSPLESAIESFVGAAGSNLLADGGYKPYLRRLVGDILQESHGTLLAVIARPKQGGKHTTLADGVWPEPALALADLLRTASASRTADALADLHAAETLLRGMVNSDGVVVFGSDGTVLAYRVFLKPKTGEKGKLSEEGGGRRRTYELMKLRLGSPFKAALFRSHDGETACEVTK